MTETLIVDIGRQTIQVALMVALPMLAVSLIVGLTVSLLQVATSLQDVTLTFVPKMVAVGITLILAAPWILHVLESFAQKLFSDFSRFLG